MVCFKIIPHSQICEFIRIVRSRTTTNGESDLELSFMDQNTKKITLLIENKVDAIFQKNTRVEISKKRLGICKVEGM